MKKEILNKFLPDITEEKSFTARSGKVDRTGNFYHVTQQTCNRTNLFSVEAVKYRDFLLKKLCENHRVLPICNVIMPTHTHDVLFTDKFSNIQTVFKILNLNVSKFIQKERAVNNKSVNVKVFDTGPSYERISTVEHLFYLFKYLYDNPLYLKESGKFVPYSSFSSWEKGYFKPYNELFYKSLFDMSIQEITSKCQLLSKDEFKEFAHSKFGNLEKI